MFRESNVVANFYVAGFQYHDGAFILHKLEPGTKLNLIAESDNPYDHDAVALYYKNTHIGYIPRGENGTVAQMLRFGHDDVYDAFVLSADKTAPIYEQVYVSLRIHDKTAKNVC